MFNTLFIGFIVIFLILIVIGGIYAFIVSKKVKSEGIETTAVVSRVVETETTDLDHLTKTSYTHYIRYTNQAGEQVEAVLSNPSDELSVGTRIRIKYLPDRQEYPVMIDHINRPE